MTDDICGCEDTSTGEPCQRAAGWGRDADDGFCIDHADGEGGTGPQTLLEEQPAITQVVAGELQHGAEVDEACAEAEISEDQYKKWRARGADDDAAEVFRTFRTETTRARKIGKKTDRDSVKEQCRKHGDTKTLWKIHRQQYGDLYDDADTGTDDAVPMVVPDGAIPDA